MLSFSVNQTVEEKSIRAWTPPNLETRMRRNKSRSSPREKKQQPSHLFSFIFFCIYTCFSFGIRMLLSWMYNFLAFSFYGLKKRDSKREERWWWWRNVVVVIVFVPLPLYILVTWISRSKFAMCFSHGNWVATYASATCLHTFLICVLWRDIFVCGVNITWLMSIFCSD